MGVYETCETDTHLSILIMKIKKVSGVIFAFLIISTFYACEEIEAGEIGSPSEPVNQSIDSAGQDLPKQEIGITVTVPPDDIGQIQVQPIQSSSVNFAKEIQIAYIKDKNIWTWSRENGNQQLTFSGGVDQIKIHPDGQLIAYLKQADDFHGELWIIDFNGQNERRVLGVFELDQLGSGARDPNSVAINPYQFNWIPGTRKIAFNTRQVFQDSSFIRLDDLNWVDIDSLERRTIIPPFQGGNFRYSQNGAFIAVATPSEISLIPADGSDRKIALEYEQVISYSEQKYYADPIWSPDSKSLYVAISPVDPLAEPRNPTTLWEIPVSGEKAFQIGSIIAQPFISSEVIYSPDVQKIMFLRETGHPSENRSELFIANNDGTEELPVQKDKFIQLLGWSPDSNLIVFKQGENWEARIGRIGNPPEPLLEDSFGIFNIKWVNTDTFLILKEYGDNFLLVLNSLKGESIIVDEIPAPPTDFDFIN